MASVVIRMKFHKNKFLTTVSAIALVLAVGACSSSDDDDMALMMNGGDDTTNGGDDTTNGGDDTKTPAETLADARDALKALPDDATDDVRAAAMTELVAALKLAGNEAAYVAYLEEKVADQAQTVADAEAKIALAAKIARAKEIARAIDASRNAGESAAAAGDADIIAFPRITDDVTVTGVTTKRNAAGVVTVALTGADADEFTGGDASAGTVWSSGTLMRTNDDKSEDTIVVYTDVAAPTPTTLRLQLTMGEVLVSDVTGNRGFVVPTEAPSGDADLTYKMDGEFKGTFRGIPGTFECTSATCAVSLDAKKKPMIAEGEGDLSFIPDSIGDTYDAPDTAYTYFGWWLNKADKEDGDHTVQVFSGGVSPADGMMNAYPGAHVADLTGKAVYKGPAAGKYATKTITAGALSDAEAGHFTAAATLTANFDSATPDDNDGTISGMVTGFEASDGVDASAWKVTLGTAPLTADSVTFTGETDVNFGGGKEEMAGDWQGSFYNDTDTDAMDDAPGTVAGTFSVTTSGASVIGGFGATKQ